ncbi:MAG: 8-oxo-dGTP diphosphatase [Candidatus Saccharimonadales bacterium]
MKICTLLLLRKDDEILLAMKKRGFGVGRWNGVGGKIEADETIEQALVRECQEEISVTPTELNKVAIHDFKFPNGANDMQVHTYFCDNWQGEPVESQEMAPEWFKISEIPYNEMWQDDIIWLPLVLLGKSLKTEFSFDNNDNIKSAKLTIVKNLE